MEIGRLLRACMVTLAFLAAAISARPALAQANFDRPGSDYVNAPVVSLTPGVGDDILVETFVVVVIGGVGSFPGAVLGGLIAGEIISITSMFNPGYAYVMLFAAMTLVLVALPHGLLGARGRD